jgi:hypothetical protein
MKSSLIACKTDLLFYVAHGDEDVGPPSVPALYLSPVFADVLANPISEYLLSRNAEMFAEAVTHCT